MSTVTAAPPTDSRSPWGAPLPGDDPWLGRIIAGRFKVEAFIGEGGMGRVYRARHLALDTDVCIKVLRGARHGEQDSLRFQREAQAAGRLRSAHCVQVLDSGRDEADGLQYIAMEFIHGRNLKRLLTDDFPLGEERICHLVEQLLSACGEAHAQRVIHRDLKPANVMIEKRREDPDFVKVLDFGIAKIQEPEFVSITNTNAACGTPAYMSPEQGLGEKLDGRSDLYSVGVILYQLVTGRLPFEGRTPLEVLTKHQTDMPLPPRLCRPEVAISLEMEQLILQALQKDPAKRPQTAEAFRDALLRHGERLRRERERTQKSEKSIPPAAAFQPTVEGTVMEAPQAISRRPPEAPRPETPSPSTGTIEREMREALGPSRRGFYGTIGVGCALTIGLGVLWLRPTAAPPPMPMAPVATPSPMPRVSPSVVQARAAQAPTTPAPVAPPQPAAASGDAEKAKRLVYQSADPAYYEENFAKAERLYRQAIEADPSYAPAYYGLFRAGLGASDHAAIVEGGKGFLRLSPHAREAGKVRQALKGL